MELFIDTTDKDNMILKIEDNGFKIKKSIKVNRNQAEKLLPELNKLLLKHKLKLSDVSKIVVENNKGSFTSLRIGIATANALAYALQIPVEDINGKSISKKHIKLVRPEYEKEVMITIPKKSAS
ncbi:MAG: hypothetical protein ABIG10_04045 [bacterium]